MPTVLNAFFLVLQAEAAPVSAPAAHNLQIGRMLRFSDGRRIGEVMRIDRDGAGQPRGVVVIFGSGTVIVPASTLSDKDHGLLTSLGYRDVQGLAR
ncbi:hypothetical protein [Flavisphingomonas formosensis]|uniref:hypothetical protein n=1 Tax=Flavisphingomonas formosensis TaxID=861534 RepID=UPI0018DFD900|nr:hypothetical protein [Sphingomonas formosensis]